MKLLVLLMCLVLVGCGDGMTAEEREIFTFMKEVYPNAPRPDAEIIEHVKKMTNKQKSHVFALKLAKEKAPHLYYKQMAEIDEVIGKAHKEKAN